MSDKTELTWEDVEALLAGATPGPWMQPPQVPRAIVAASNPGLNLLGERVFDDGESYAVVASAGDARLIAAAPTLARQLLAEMDDSARHLNNLGRFVSQVAMALGLPATSAPEVVLRQAAVTFDGAHRFSDERDRLQADNARITDELAEARATLAAERGEAEGAPSEGWENRGDEWAKDMPDGQDFVVVAKRWIHSSRGWWFCGKCYPTAREAMRAADAALATMEPPDAD